MKLSGTYTFDAPRDIVWDSLMDPEVLARVMPGCEKLEQVGENEYEAALKIKVGPVQGKFKGGVTLEDINEPDSYQMKVNGKGAAGFMDGVGAVRLEDNGDSTIMHYDGDAKVGGKIASVGQRLLDSSAKALTKQSLDGLHKQILARAEAAKSATESGDVEAVAAPPPVVKVEAPSEMEFAAGVAKNMVDEIIPPAWRPVAIVVALIIVGSIIYAVL